VPARRGLRAPAPLRGDRGGGLTGRHPGRVSHWRAGRRQT
jgi:hypothetical protein